MIRSILSIVLFAVAILGLVLLIVHGFVDGSANIPMIKIACGMMIAPAIGYFFLPLGKPGVI